MASLGLPNDENGWLRVADFFLSYPYMNNGFLLLLNTKYLFLYWKNIIKVNTPRCDMVK